MSETTWRGQPHYRCPHCPYDTFDEQRYRTHLARKHRSAPEPEGDSDDAPNLASMTRAELDVYAADHGIDNPGTFDTKADLIAALEGRKE